MAISPETGHFIPDGQPTDFDALIEGTRQYIAEAEPWVTTAGNHSMVLGRLVDNGQHPVSKTTREIVTADYTRAIDRYNTAQMLLKALVDTSK